MQKAILSIQNGFLHFTKTANFISNNYIFAPSIR